MNWSRDKSARCPAYHHHQVLVYYVMSQACLLDTRGFSLYLFRWRHWEITSERLFNNISLGSSRLHETLST